MALLLLCNTNSNFLFNTQNILAIIKYLADNSRILIKKYEILINQGHSADSFRSKDSLLKAKVMGCAGAALCAS